jgi:hypothetical protein
MMYASLESPNAALDGPCIFCFLLFTLCSLYGNILLVYYRTRYIRSTFCALALGAGVRRALDRCSATVIISKKKKEMNRPCPLLRPFYLSLLVTLTLIRSSYCSYSLTVQSESEECFVVRTPGKGKSLIRYCSRLFLFFVLFYHYPMLLYYILIKNINFCLRSLIPSDMFYVVVTMICWMMSFRQIH